MTDLAELLSEHDQNFRKARLPALYSDFRPQRTLNPDGYRANIVAWREALSFLSLRGLISGRVPNSSLLVLTVDKSLPQQLESKSFGQPLALGAAIRQAIADQEFIPVNTFLQPLSATHYTRNLSSLSWNTAEWVLRQLGIIDRSNSEDSVPTGRYVVKSNVEAVCQTFKSQVVGASSHLDRVFTKLQFQTLFAPRLVTGHCLTEEDVEVLLTSLSRDKRFIDYNGNVIRIRCPSDGLDITTEDVAAASIKELTANLRHQTDILNSRIDSLGQETRAALERKNRIAAQALLKSRKLAESSLAKRYATLNQLEDIAAKMEQASDQAQLVNVMETSAIALKFLNTRVGGTSRVDEVMDQIREQMSEVDEVAAILAESTGEPVDESQIDDELEMLENEALGKAKLEPVQQEKTQEASNTEQIQAQLANLPLPPGPVISDSGGLDAEAIESRVASLSLDHS